MIKSTLVFFLWLLPIWVGGFVFQSSLTSSPCIRQNAYLRPKTLLAMSSEEMPSSPPKRRRKRKKKVDSEESSETSEMEVKTTKRMEQEFDLKPRENAGVEFQIQDVRDVVAGVKQSEPSLDSPEASPSITSVAASSSIDSMSDTLSSQSVSSSSDDSFERLLEDARRMKAESGESVDGESGEGSIKTKARNILSTIVTVDFFVVFAFLLWFLAGLFSITVFNDDTIQLAFNRNFELLVQPALGVLMLGTVVGNFLKDEEEED